MQINFKSNKETYLKFPVYSFLFFPAILIDKCGLKGYNVGDAYVSDLHAGFIVNKGNATAKDVLELIEYIKKRVYEEFNKKIELEIEIVGED